LNNAFYSRETETPADMLNLLNVGMTYTLKQKKSRSTIRDGMAIGICSFNKKTWELQYAGANNNLFIIRNSKLIEIKGNITPIGAFMEEEISTFRNHTFQLAKGDMVYLFSDGYSDQFGGIHGRKYMKRKLKNFLSRISHLPMQEQKELLDDEHTRWKGNFQQVDDILIFGIRANYI
jgi:serine phosphatase RsbU (regulator of sigma subunit)